MAFEKTGEWQASRFTAPAAPGLTSRRIIPARFDTAAGRSVAAVVSILINGVAVWMLLNITSKATLTRPAEKILALIDVSAASSKKEEERGAPPENTGAAARAAPTLVDTTPNALPSEWSVGTVRVFTPSPSAAPSAGGANAGTGPGGGGGSGYDPYAGAAPLGGAGRYVSGLATADSGKQGAASAGDPSIDQGELSQALAQFRRDEPGARGSCDAIVSVSPTGMALDVKFLRCTLSRKATASLKSALLGRQLVRSDLGSGRREARISSASLGLS